MIVTTPQAVALLDALKCLSFTRAVALPVLGVVENMSGYACPCCGEVANVFSTGGGAAMAAREGVPLLGALPVDTALVELLDAAAPAEAEAEAPAPDAAGEDGATARSFELLRRYRETASAALFGPIVDAILENLPKVEGAGAQPAEPAPAV